MDGKKYFYEVVVTGDSYATGRVPLTKKEAETVAFATNPENWKKRRDDRWCSRFYINLENPIPEEWWDEEMT